MAHGQPPTNKNSFPSFLLKRFLVIATVLFAIFAGIWPDSARSMISNVLFVIMSAIGPYLPQLFMLVVALWGIRFLIEPFLPSKKKKKDPH